MDIEQLLGRFPKTRPELPPEIAEIYQDFYKANREGRTPASALSQRVESWLHRRVAEDVVGRSGPLSTLEIGAGTLNQLRHEPSVGPYDIVEPFRELFEDSPHLDRVRATYSDVAEITDDGIYDRITSVATFEHIEDLPMVVARCGLLLAPGGNLRVAIPSDGTLLWWLGWKLTTGLEFRLRHGLDHDAIVRHEHLNTAREVEALLNFFFADVRRRLLGVSRGLSLYQFYRCRDPELSACREYLAGRLAT